MSSVEIKIKGADVTINVDGKEAGNCKNEAYKLIESLGIGDDTDQVYDKEQDIVVTR